MGSVARTQHRLKCVRPIGEPFQATGEVDAGRGKPCQGHPPPRPEVADPAPYGDRHHVGIDYLLGLLRRFATHQLPTGSPAT